MHSVQIFCLVRSLALWLSAQEQKNVRDLSLIKKKKLLVDIAPHWGEPHISCVFGFVCAMLFML